MSVELKATGKHVLWLLQLLVGCSRLLQLPHHCIAFLELVMMCADATVSMLAPKQNTYHDLSLITDDSGFRDAYV